MLTVELQPGSEQTFYLQVASAPAKIKIAYSVTSEDSTPIDFKVSLFGFSVQKHFNGSHPVMSLLLCSTFLVLI